jgi:hypothetical protein
LLKKQTGPTCDQNRPKKNGQNPGVLLFRRTIGV